jgi:hypothetical protein
MPKIEIELSDDDYAKLEAHATRDLRLPEAQAKVFILESLGAWRVKSPQKAVSKPKAATSKPMVTRPVGSDGIQGISHGA